MGAVDERAKSATRKKRKRSESSSKADGEEAEEHLATRESEDLPSPEKIRKNKKKRKDDGGEAVPQAEEGGIGNWTTGEHHVEDQEAAPGDEVASTKKRKKAEKRRRSAEAGEEGQVASEAAGEGRSSMEEEEKEEEGPAPPAAGTSMAAPASTAGGTPSLTSGLELVRRLLSGHTRRSDLTAQQQRPPAASSSSPAGQGQDKAAAPAKVVVVEEDPAVRRSASEMAGEWGLDRRLLPQLERHGVRGFFAVQCRVLPYLISTNRADLVRDVVVSAPTGSGKTLVYVMALLQGLRERRIVRLRGLVVVPNRDLAVQVMAEFDKYAPAVGLKVGLAIGQSDFSKEQARIVGSSSRAGGRDGGVGGVSLVDVLVATPGRLMDHMERSPGFTLQHLKYLVIDEVDRLVTQSYQDWVPKVYEAAYGQTRGHVAFTPDDQPAHLLRPATVRVRPESKQERPVLPALPPVPLRKLLFSATVTSNPQKLALLDLRNPRYFSITSVAASANDDGAAPPDDDDDDDDEAGGNKRGGGRGVEGKFSTPERLREWCVACSTEKKPLVLLQLLHLPSLASGLVLVFTSSLDSTHRLARLLQLCLPPTHGVVEEFSSALTQPQRADLIRRCGEGGVRVLVSSDGMARGIDLPNVDAVINYDVPARAKTYVHRVGRTARAGRAGASYSLVKHGQEQQFARMRASVDAKRVEPLPLPTLVQQQAAGAAEEEALLPAYRRGLARLRSVLAMEKQGRLKPSDPVRDDEGDDDEEEEQEEVDIDEEDLIEGPAADEGNHRQDNNKSPHKGRGARDGSGHRRGKEQGGGGRQRGRARGGRGRAPVRK